MDSFYPKFGEVELVLVEDNNDFYDPLETNFDFENENEDVKLQLNDTVIEENPFHLNIDNYEDEPSPECIDDSDDDITEVISDNNDDYDKTTDPRNNVKAEYTEDIDDESMDAEDDCFIDEGSDISSIDTKSNIKERSTPTNDVKHVEDENPTKHKVEKPIELIEPIVPLKEPKLEKQISKTLPKLNRKTKSKISERNKIKKEDNVEKRRPKEEQSVSTQ